MALILSWFYRKGLYYPWSVIPTVQVTIIADGYDLLPHQASLSPNYPCAYKAFRSKHFMNT